VFTDIVASTERASDVGDRIWKERLDRHDEMSERQVQRFGGRIVKMTGDGMLATFDGPAQAIQAAIAVRDAVGQLGIELRVGVHTGEVELRGDDIGGIAVHIAARVLGLAKAGEVLVSRTVADLVAGSGIEFEDRGEHELRGVTGTWTLFAVEG
jgi:class 3 adenylate cyclase